MECKGDRLNLMTDVLNGIKTIKLNAWEKCFESRISLIKGNEMDCVKNTKIFLYLSYLMTEISLYAVSIFILKC